MKFDAEQIYRLLPSVYRSRDEERGQPLKALLTLISEQTAVLEEDLAQLYDDHFIETCADWVVPYIGDLVGASQLHSIGGATTLPRAVVANTIGYRRRKGTLLALEQVAADATGRPVRVVESFRSLAIDQSLRHVRPQHGGYADLRRGSDLSRLGGPFEVAFRTIDVRRAAPSAATGIAPKQVPLDKALHGGGRANIPNLGTYVWRWNSYRITRQPAVPVDQHRFMFSPLGNDMPLFNDPPRRSSFERLTTRANVPQPISRREFHDGVGDFYGEGRSLLIRVNGMPVEQEAICACNLEDIGIGGEWPTAPADKVAIDPVLGRIAFGENRSPVQDVSVDYCYGAPGDTGGGPYDRSERFPAHPINDPWRMDVDFGSRISDGRPLRDAIEAYGRQPPGMIGLIVLKDFGIAHVDLTGPLAIRIARGSQLWIVAASTPGDGWGPSGARATLTGNIEIRSGERAPSQASEQPRVFLSGILLAGSLRVTEGVAHVTLQDCTVVPGGGLTRDGSPLDPDEPSICVETAGSEIHLSRSIVGSVRVHSEASATIDDCVLDAIDPWRVGYVGPDGLSEGGALSVSGTTLIGCIRTRQVDLASNSIFLARRPTGDPWPAALWVTRRQSGCIRFSYVPSDALAPRRYLCHPDDPIREHVLAPAFVSLRYGSPSYMLLSGDCPLAIWRGADDESQIGGCHFMREPQRIANLEVLIPEYTPFGLEGGVFIVPSRGATVGTRNQFTSYGGWPMRGHEVLADPLSRLAIGGHLI